MPMMAERVRPRPWWAWVVIAAAMVMAALWLTSDREAQLPAILGAGVQVFGRVESGVVGVLWFDPARSERAFSVSPIAETRGSFWSARWRPEMRGDRACRLVLLPWWAVAWPVFAAWGVAAWAHRRGRTRGRWGWLPVTLALGHVGRLALVSVVIAAAPWTSREGLWRSTNMTIVGMNTEGFAGAACAWADLLPESLKRQGEAALKTAGAWRWWGRDTTAVSVFAPTAYAMRPIAVNTGLFAVLIGVPGAVIVWRTRRRAVMATRCDACGYDLSGGTGAVCPECGRGVL